MRAFRPRTFVRSVGLVSYKTNIQVRRAFASRSATREASIFFSGQTLILSSIVSAAITLGLGSIYLSFAKDDKNTKFGHAIKYAEPSVMLKVIPLISRARSSLT